MAKGETGNEEGAERGPQGQFAPGNAAGRITRWQVGQSGNPNGRPPNGQTITPLLRAWLVAKADCLLPFKKAAEELGLDPSQVTVANVLAAQLVRRAMRGNRTAILEINNRIDGRPDVTMEGQDQHRVHEPLIFEIVPARPRPPADQTASKAGES